MEITKHAKIKERQIGGAEGIFLGKKERQHVISGLKKMIQMLDKAKGLNIIVSRDNIITVYKN